MENELNTVILFGGIGVISNVVALVWAVSRVKSEILQRLVKVETKLEMILKKG